MMKFAYLFIFIALLSVSQAGLPTDWHGYIAVLIQKHSKCPFAPVIIHAPVPPPWVPTSLPEHTCPSVTTTTAVSSRHSTAVPPPMTATVPSVQHYFLPDVLIWDPLHQYPQLFRVPLQCPEDGCNLPMQFLTWQDGSKVRYQLRTLYGINGIVLLVGQIFRCSCGHLVTNYDPRLLSIFPDRSCLPFMLLHKCGLTVELINFIFALASQGTSFKDIHQAIKGSCEARYYQSQIAYWCAGPGYGLGQSSCMPALPVTFPEIAQQK